MSLRAVVLAVALSPAAAAAGPYEFLAAPQTDLNRIYRVERLTGEVTACQYGLKEGTVGVTLCYPAGEGAAAGTAGEYALVASRHEREGGVFRVNHRSGEISVCYVFGEEVVCTPQAQAAARKAAAAPPPATPAAPAEPKETGTIVRRQ